MANFTSASLGPTPSLAPLHAKWGWIVALGVVYLVAGIIALTGAILALVLVRTRDFATYGVAEPAPAAAPG